MFNISVKQVKHYIVIPFKEALVTWCHTWRRHMKSHMDALHDVTHGDVTWKSHMETSHGGTHGEDKMSHKETSYDISVAHTLSLVDLEEPLTLRILSDPVWPNG